MLLAGAGTWITISSQLSAERVTVSEDASMFAGSQVRGPLTAYAQAEVINKHALAASEGKTYAELGKDDPTRATVMNGSFLRASLFTSVVSYGVSALVMGLGVLFGLLGYALRRIGAVPALAAGTSTPTLEVVTA
ncbi:aromatic ring-opening dioxygenase LigA [Oerskovia sp. M15]